MSQFPCPKCHAHPRPTPCELCHGAGVIDDVQLSQHFRLSEMLRSDTAIRRGFDNAPNAQQIENLRRLCVDLLDPIAEHFGGLLVTSGYRSPVLNVAIGGSNTSSHCAPGVAAAADTHAADSAVTLVELLVYARDSGLAFDQIIYEYGSWIHFSHRRTDGSQRREVLMKFAGSGYLPFEPTDPRVRA